MFIEIVVGLVSGFVFLAAELLLVRAGHWRPSKAEHDHPQPGVAVTTNVGRDLYGDVNTHIENNTTTTEIHNNMGIGTPQQSGLTDAEVGKWIWVTVLGIVVASLFALYAPWVLIIMCGAVGAVILLMILTSRETHTLLKWHRSATHVWIQVVITLVAVPIVWHAIFSTQRGDFGVSSGQTQAGRPSFEGVEGWQGVLEEIVNGVKTFVVESGLEGATFFLLQLLAAFAVALMVFRNLLQVQGWSTYLRFAKYSSRDDRHQKNAETFDNMKWYDFASQLLLLALAYLCATGLAFDFLTKGLDAFS